MDDKKSLLVEPEDTTSLEYEDDFALVSPSETPSFDVDEVVEDVLADDECDFNYELEGEFSEPSSFTEIPENVTVETEFFDEKRGKRKCKQVRVKFQDVSKPYVPKVTSLKNYTNFLHLVNDSEKPPTDVSPDSGINELAGLSLEEQEKQKQEWANQLEHLEDQINTLRLVLSLKVEEAHKLKQKLGITVWKEFQDDMTQGIRNVKNSNVYQRVEERVEQIGKAVVEAPIYQRVEETIGHYSKAVVDAALYQRLEEKVGEINKAVVGAPLYQKTESVIKATTEKTSTILGGLGSGISCKLGQLKNSESFRSLEEKVGSAYENVKTKVTTSRSSSNQSFDDVLRETDGRRMMSPVATTTIEEDRCH